MRRRPRSDSPSLLPRQPLARSRIVSTADNVAEDALSWITPSNCSGSPIASRSQRTIMPSISVAAGEVCHSMHCAAMVLTNISASMDGAAALDVK